MVSSQSINMSNSKNATVNDNCCYDGQDDADPHFHIWPVSVTPIFFLLQLFTIHGLEMVFVWNLFNKEAYTGKTQWAKVQEDVDEVLCATPDVEKRVA